MQGAVFCCPEPARQFLEKKMENQFQAGYKAGVNADVPLSPFEMSKFYEDFKIGYVVGLAHVHSVRCASAWAGASEAAEMGQKYLISYESLKPHFTDPSDPEVLEFLQRGYGIGDDDYDEDDQ